MPKLNRRYVRLNGAAEVKKVVDAIPPDAIVAVDTETSGLEEDCSVLLYSFCHEPGVGYMAKTDTLPVAKKTLEAAKLVYCNAAFDAPILRRHGVNVGIHADVMLMDWIVDVARPHDLKSIAERELGVVRQTFKERFSFIPDGKKKAITPSVQEILDDPKQAPDFWEYAGTDAVDTFEVYHTLKKVIVQRGYWDTFLKWDMPMVDILNEMHQIGIRLDKKMIEGIGVELAKKIDASEKAFRKLVGKPDINLASTPQLVQLFFSKEDGGFGLPVVATTEKGNPQLNAAVLQAMAEEKFEPAKILLEYKGAKTMKGTFIDGLLERMDADHNVHTTFKMTSTGYDGDEGGTSTGRLSSRDPNLQNIPVMKEKDPYRIRKAFIARPGCVFVVADYSQVELRLAAHFSEDPTMVDAFKHDRDLHSITAKKIFDLDCKENEVKEKFADERRIAKTINFGLQYGMAAYSLSGRLGISELEAQKYIDAYFDLYPGLRGWMTDTINSCRDKDYVTTIVGRRRYLTDINLPVVGDEEERKRRRGLRGHAERQAINTPIQGSAADMIKVAMVVLKKKLPVSSRMILQIHDELIVECPKAQGERVCQIVKDVMESTGELFKIIVPIEVTAKVASNWEEGK